MKRLAIPVILASLLAVAPAVAEPLTIVAWAPGFPGDTEQAQPSMDTFAAGVAEAAGWDDGALRAVYHSEVDAGLAFTREHAAVALVSLPVWVEFGEELGLEPLLGVVQQNVAEETWSLVAKAGAVAGPADLAAWEVRGAAGFSPRFVKAVLASWGELPDGTGIVFEDRVLSALRRAAAGDPVAALLDRAQTEALPRLPFASDLEVVASSGALPSSVVCAVGDRLPQPRRDALVAALLALAGGAAGEEVLATIRLERFAPLDASARGAIDALRGDAPD